jgi:4-amino-4-deoxy-L-arabinose transferase-like glycosyltransferase
MAEVYKRPIAALFLICFIAWLPGFFTIPALDRDESRFAQASKQMLETGNFVDIQQGYEKRYKKPVGIYWMQAATTAVIDAVRGDHTHGDIWTYRVVSFIGAFLAVALTYWTASAIAGVEASFLSGLLLGLCLLVVAESKIAKTDAMLLATIVGSMGVLLRVWLADQKDDTGQTRSMPTLWIILSGWAAFGIGLLVKAPVNLLVIGATVLAVSVWSRRGRWLLDTKPLLGIPLALLIFVPWIVAIAFISHGAFFEGSLGHDFANKIAGGEETHGAPPGYYTVAQNISFWPATLFLLPAILYGVRRHEQPAIRFLLCWAGATWLMFELAPTKLPHYVMPAYPALAILAGLWFTSPPPEAENRWDSGLRIASTVLFTLVGVAIAGFLIYAPMRYGDGPPAWLYGASAVGALAVLATAYFAIAQRRAEAIAAVTVSALVLYYTAGFGAAPRLTQLWVSETAKAVVDRHTQPHDPPVISSGYQEASLTFRLGTKTHLAGGVEAGNIAAVQGGLALIEDGERDTFLESLEEQGAQATQVDRFSGFNYSRGRAVHITVYRISPAYHVTSPPPE